MTDPADLGSQLPFAFTDEHLLFRESVRGFVRARLADSYHAPGPGAHAGVPRDRAADGRAPKHAPSRHGQVGRARRRGADDPRLRGPAWPLWLVRGAAAAAVDAGRERDGDRRR